MLARREELRGNEILQQNKVFGRKAVAISGDVTFGAWNPVVERINQLAHGAA
jgi:hypothetical protein